jgi:hypothetical protein
MYLTNDKQRHRLLIGSYNTRKWNDYSSLIYFEKIYGGKPLLKKIKSIGLENNIEFHSAMVQGKYVWTVGVIWLDRIK